MADIPNPKGNIPVPDPTLLTTQQLIREMGGLRELLESQIHALQETLRQREIVVTSEIKALQEVLETRLDGMDKAIAILQTISDRFPSMVAHEISQLKILHEEKFLSTAIQFDGIQKQFEERDTRTEQTSQASTTAINAALQAAKEAVGQQECFFALATSKSEAATTKQIDALQVLFQTGNKATDEKIEEMRGRLLRMEGAGIGQLAAKAENNVDRTSQQGSNMLVIAIVGAAVSGVIALAAVIISLIKPGGLF